MGNLVRRLGAGGIGIRSLAVAALGSLLLSLGTPAYAFYSSIVLDADSGSVVMQHDPDTLNYPASLTKMMTLYLTFEGLERGKLSMDQQFTVTAHAASQAPSKLGLRPGETLSLHDLVFSVITHSANDAAVVIAENIAGSEPAFAQRMTAKARALGMSNTNFANASGLPNPDNLTTPRDLATLALALYRNFPKEYAWFSTEEYTFRGVSYANHNHLMASFRGMDGIKTGYIRASGFNLAASAVRDGRRLVAVVMGGESAHSRDMQMAALLDAAFARPAGEEIADDPEATPRRETIMHRAGRAFAALSPVGHAEAATPADNREAREHRHPAGDAWSIQVGAFAQRSAAERAASQAAARVPGGKHHAVEVIGSAGPDKEHLFRARVVHFNERQAEAACRTLHKRHQACTLIAPEAARMQASR